MTYRPTPAEESNLARLGLKFDADRPVRQFQPGDAGLVTFRHANGEAWGSALPYTRGELIEVIRQGRERPRPLTAAETALADKNRAIAYEDAMALEDWARTDLSG